MRPVSIRCLDPRLRLDRRAVAGVFRVLDSAAGLLAVPGAPWDPSGELSVVFLTDGALAELHGRFLGDPSSTDVITFPGDPSLGTAGEICVSAAAAARFASDSGGSFSDELTLYLVHGWLHLAGHDDLRPSLKRSMRRAEGRAMRALRAAKAVPRFILARARG